MRRMQILAVALAGIVSAGLFPGFAPAAQAYGEKHEAAFAAGVAAYDAGDYSRAYAVWKPLAKKGDPAAQRNVAHLLRKGQGVKADPKRAFKYYERAAEAGLMSAKVNLAFLYLDGTGTKKDPRAAAELFYAAAKKGHAESQFQIGRMLESGTGMKADPAKAIPYYMAAAKKGHAAAQYHLGGIRLVGESLRRIVPETALSTAEPKHRAVNHAAPLFGGTRAPRSSRRTLFGR